MTIAMFPTTADAIMRINLNDWQADEIGDDREMCIRYCLSVAVHSFAVIDGGPAGEVLLIASVGTLSERHGLIDAFVAHGIGARLVSVTRMVRRMMRTLPFDRYTAWVDAGHEDGSRWADALGMAREGFSPHFRHGRDIIHFGWLRAQEDQAWRR